MSCTTTRRAGTNTFSVSYNAENKELTWTTRNIFRTNDAASLGIVAGFIEARGIQQQQWANVMVKVYEFLGKPTVKSSGETVLEYDYYDWNNRIGEFEQGFSKNRPDLFIAKK